MRGFLDIPSEPAAQPSRLPLTLTRRQFLAWSAALGCATGLPFAQWGRGGPLRVGIVGLGSRGRTALAACATSRNLDVVALCDRRAGLAEETARELAASATWLATQPERLFGVSSADAWILAAAPADQLALAAAACAAGRDVLLVPPIAFAPAAVKVLESAASKYQRQVHVARTTAFALDGGRAAGLRGEQFGSFVSADLVAHVAVDEHLPGEMLLTSLIDEVDFAGALLGGQVVQTLRVGLPSPGLGRLADARLQLRLLNEEGHRRQLTIAALAHSVGVPAKRSRVVLTGPRGALSLAGIPITAPDASDLVLFFEAVRNRHDRAALSLPRLLEVLGYLQFEERHA